MSVAALLSFALALGVSSAALAGSQVIIQHEKPDQEVAALVAAELAFNHMAEVGNIRDAFFENMADNAIMFRPGPVNGKDYFRGRPANPGPVLTWYPSYAELAGSGEFGWTTGPWEFRPAKDKPVEAWGHFATVWQKQPSGKWKVLIDEGHSCEKPPQDSLSWARMARQTPEGEVIPLTKLSDAHEKLRAADAAYSKALVEGGVGKALALYADDDVRLLRDDRPALQGAAQAGKDLAHEWDGGVVAWDTKAGGISQDASIAFTYGTVTVPAKGKDASAGHKVFRIWRHATDGAWKLAFDATNPMPPPTPPPPPTPKTP